MRPPFALHHWPTLCGLLLVLSLAGCGSIPTAPLPDSAAKRAPPTAGKTASSYPALPAAGSGRGGYYQDDGPGERPPSDLDQVPDAEPKVESYSLSGNKPYVVFGKTYTPITDNRPFVQRGTGSWYGKKFHGQKTSSGERYDMYKMSAAHPTLPIPSYARVTNLSNGRQVIVRVNDRGPFHSSRIIDLSYTAALKLGYLGSGSSQLQVERLLPDEIARLAQNKGRPAESSQAAVVMPAAPGGGDPLKVELMPVSLPAVEVRADAISTGAPNGASNALLVAAVNDGSAAAGGFYLQFGAYAQSGNAESVRQRLTRNWDGSWPPLQVVQSGTLYRLFGGPFATRGEALATAQKMADAGAGKPVIVQR